jgi:hypothetical protein
MDVFQQQMGTMFHNMSVIDIFMDDIIVFGYADFPSHLHNVAEVLHYLLVTGMQENPDKCHWFQSSITYLGFLITCEGIKS